MEDGEGMLHQKGGWGQRGSGGWCLEPSQCQPGHIAVLSGLHRAFSQEGTGFLSSVAPSLTLWESEPLCCALSVEICNQKPERGRAMVMHCRRVPASGPGLRGLALAFL